MLVCLALLFGCSALGDRDQATLPDERAQRCVSEHPTTPSEMQAVLDESHVIDDCEGDDGACQASTECTGTVEARECEPETVLSRGAAACVATAAGLQQGLRDVQASLTYHVGLRRIVWQVQNVTSASIDGRSSGTGITIDAVTGEVLDSFGWSATP